MTDKAQGAAERELFEQAMNDMRQLPRELDFSMTKSPSGRPEYANTHLESCWVGWRAGRAALKAQPAPTEAQGNHITDVGGMVAAQVYTCNGKGGDYEFIGTAHGAGTSREQGCVIVYMDVADGALYFRTPTDFADRMKAVPAKAGTVVQGEDSARLDAERLPSMNPACGCKACNPQMIGRMMFICGLCGDKRCPHIENHANPCQGRARASAETGGVKS